RSGVNRPSEGDEGGVVAHFIASDSFRTVGQFNATIDGGDGKPSTGEVRQSPASPLVFEVIGDHKYQREGPYVITVRIADTRNQVGGFAASNASLGKDLNEEDIARLAASE